MEKTSTQPQSAWVARPAADVDVCAAIAKGLGCPEAIAQVLVSRGIDTLASAREFFEPRIEALLDSPETDPMGILGMPAAVERILAAIRADEPMLIYGDYDVDGTTATVLLKTAIERVGLALEPPLQARVSYHVPHRIREGYGMRSSVLGDAAEAGVRLVVSVDTGIRAVAEAVEARRLGIDLIVTDHHLPGDAADLPDAFVVVNPNQPGCSYANKDLCGAAVAYKLAQALLTRASAEVADPAAWMIRVRRGLLPSFLKLVAIATVADSVPLRGENRAIAALGLEALRNPVQPGLRWLMKLASIPLDRAPSAGEVGFRIAPRINAAGRMDVASDVVELFLTRDEARAQALAEKLDHLNQERRDSEAQALDAIERELLTMVDEEGVYPPECLILDHPDWHRGVLGILASRVVDRTGRPALVLTHADGDAHGSGRSVPGFHLLDAITAVHLAAATDEAEAGLFHRFGGHAHAVGFSLPTDRLPLMRVRMKDYAALVLDAAILVPQLNYDAELTFADFNGDFEHWLERCAPFGIGNPEPTFLTQGALLAQPLRLIQDKHVCLKLKPGNQGGTDRAISALGWSRGPIDWPAHCARLGLVQDTKVDLLYRMRKNNGPYASRDFGGLELELRAVRRSEQQ